MFATDPAQAWRAKKTTTTRRPIKVDSNFTCEYDAEGYFPGKSFRRPCPPPQWSTGACSISDPKYCHIYHFCAIGAHQVLECLNNLWYSTENQGCDWPDKSDCKSPFLHRCLSVVLVFFFVSVCPQVKQVICIHLQRQPPV